MDQTLKGLDGWRTLTGFQISCLSTHGFSFLEPWAEISERLRRISKLSLHAIPFSCELCGLRSLLRKTCVRVPLVDQTLKGLSGWRTLTDFKSLLCITQGSRSSNPGLKLANAFGVFSTEPPRDSLLLRTLWSPEFYCPKTKGHGEPRRLRSSNSPNYMLSSRCGGLAVLKTGESTLNTILKALLFPPKARIIYTKLGSVVFAQQTPLLLVYKAQSHQ